MDNVDADCSPCCARTRAHRSPRSPRNWAWRGTVQNRMSRLERDGTIVGYSVRLKPQVEEHNIRALMTIAVEGNRIDAVIAALRGDPAVAALHSTNGRWIFVAELRADSPRVLRPGARSHPPARRHREHRGPACCCRRSSCRASCRGRISVASSASSRYRGLGDLHRLHVEGGRWRPCSSRCR